MNVQTSNMHLAAISRETMACIDACTACAKMCLGTAMTHCLETGGEHVQPQHLRLMLDCASLCRTVAELMLHKSQFHHELCGLCAKACDACAEDCAKLDGMEDCVAACRACAEHCHMMARAGIV